MISPYLSNEYEASRAYGISPPVFLNNQLIYMAHNDIQLMQLTCTPGTDGWTNVTSSANWAASTLVRTAYCASVFSVVMDSVTGTEGIPSAPGYVFFCESTASSGLLILSAMPFGLPTDVQSSAFQVANPHQPPYDPWGPGTFITSDICAVSWGPTTIILSYVENGLLNWSVYDTRDIPNPLTEGFTWQPRATVSYAASDFGATEFQAVYSLEWVALDGNNFYLVTSVLADSPGMIITQMNISGDSTGLPMSDNKILLEYTADTVSAVSLQRDPAGRICAYTVGGEKSSYPGLLMCQTIATNQDPFSSPSPWLSNTWELLNGVSIKSDSQPLVTWLVGEPYNDLTPDLQKKCSSCDVYEVVIYQRKTDVLCQIAAYGTACTVSGYNQMQIPYDLSETLIVEGIFDSPIPMPNSNIANWGQSFSSPLAVLTYEFQETEVNTESTSVSSQYGIESTGGPTKGLGFAWDIAVKAGPTWQWSNTQSTSLQSQSALETEVDNTTKQISPVGQLICRGMTFDLNVYQFFAVSATQPVADAPLFTQILTYYQSQNQVPFQPYLVTPGDLDSYTREAWNSSAIALGLASPGEDYFHEVIEENALMVAPGQNYLGYSYDAGGLSNQGFQAISTDFNASGWTLNADIYMGVGMGEGFEIFGFGVDATATFLTGTTLSVQQQGSTQTSQQIGISLPSITFLPSSGTDIETVDFQLYFLPANGRWVQELIQASQAAKINTNLNLDPGSRPWRIVFLVTGYNSYDGTISYPPKRLPPPATSPEIGIWTLDLPWPPFWNVGDQVQYAVTWVDVTGQESEPSTPSNPTTVVGYACPQIINIPLGPEGTVSRGLYRRTLPNGQQMWEDWIQVLSIADNTSTDCYDAACFFNNAYPTTPPAVADSGWLWSAPYQSSYVWVPGNQVRYALSYVYPNGESQLGPWSDWNSITQYAGPLLISLPTVGGTEGSTAVNLYRQCQATDGTLVQDTTFIGQTDQSTLQDSNASLATASNSQ